jgi:hypothetical protein
MANDAVAEQTTEGWTFRFLDAIVTQLVVDYRFTLRIAGGASIVLEEPFVIDWNGARTRVPPGDARYEVAAALPLFNREVDSVRAETTGRLQVGFLDGPTLEVPANPAYESWQIVMPDGEQWIGTPGGGITHFGAT